MGYAATLTRTGQITMPKSVRGWLGVESGQRVVFQREAGKVIIEREKTAQEIAEEIDKLIPDDIRKKHMEKYAGMTSTEMQEEWLKSDDAREYFQEEIERTL